MIENLSFILANTHSKELPFNHIEISKSKPLVSIILTLYEIKPEYLNECLASILAQTYDNIEVIAINDCSPTIDYDYITELSPKIKLYKNEVNIGMNKSVNKAFSLANGKYIVRLGSDDFFDKTLIEKEVTFLEDHPLSGAVCCNLDRFGLRSQRIMRPIRWNYNKIVYNRVFRGTGYAGGMMFRRELLDYCSIDESLRICEDFDFHLQILEVSNISSIHETLYFYRSHDTNICKSVQKEERYAILDKIIAKHKKIGKHTKKIICRDNFF